MTTTTKSFADIIDNDVFDIRDVIALVEDIEDIDGIEDKISNLSEDEDAMALVAARELLGDVRGYGGDEQWRGDWYPVTFIRDSYFEDYAQELAEDCGMINKSASWPNNCIDWKRAAKELQVDYSSVEIDGVTYWYR